LEDWSKCFLFMRKANWVSFSSIWLHNHTQLLVVMVVAESDLCLVLIVVAAARRLIRNTTKSLAALIAMRMV
jgi:hypothetical protein